MAQLSGFAPSEFQESEALIKVQTGQSLKGAELGLITHDEFRECLLILSLTAPRQSHSIPPSRTKNQRIPENPKTLFDFL
ncbi:MAG: hypothetical protein DRP22_02545 [Verrucomicrobia bacterium]|nr:MAG: hypothetical protein DRP22_02545 [Verrucomicrobiota bacterium]